MRTQGPFRVYVGLVSTGYLNPAAIAETIQNGIHFCAVSRKLEKAKSKIILKPDIALAHKKLAPYAYTNPEICNATIQHVLALAPHTNLTVIGKSAYGMPTHRMFRKAQGGSETFRGRGYYELEHLFPGRVNVSPIDEHILNRYQLTRASVNEILTSNCYYDADFTIYCPKFKSNVLLEGFSGAIALGSVDLDENNRSQLDRQLCDMLEVCNPQLIIGDGIVAGIGGNSVTQRGHELGVILVSNNALAHDWIAAQILNLDPAKISHLKLAMEQGWGPSSANQIELGGYGSDGIAQLGQKSRFWDFGFVTIQDFKQKFERENPTVRFPLEILSGDSYETSGVHGGLLDWIYLTYDSPARRNRIAHWPKASVCIGKNYGYPSHQTVYVIGKNAIATIERLTSSSRKLLRLGKIEIRSLQLKNGKRHLAILSHYPDKNLMSGMFWAFTIGSLGRMTLQLLSPTLLIERYVFRLRVLWNRHKRPEFPKVVMTSKMPQNR